ncbi:MAG: hypothetical protein ACFE8Z_08270 [Candidatus Hermodarchaeota archaeon]
MKTRRRFTLVVFALAVTVLLLANSVASQTSLVPNEERESEFIWGREDSFYDPNDYEVTLAAGHWTVVVRTSMFSDLEVSITVARDSAFTDIIVASGTGWGHHPSVDFDLSSSETVYIRVHENSVYGDTSGNYDIGVYDDAHGPPPDDFFPGFDLWGWLMPFMIIPFVFVFCILIVVFGSLRRRGRMPLRRARMFQRRQLRRMRHFTMDAPDYAIPDEHRGQRRSDGTDIRTVRVPTKCPNCAASLSQDDIDWVGPLEAECKYCGASVRATFERV